MVRKLKDEFFLTTLPLSQSGGDSSAAFYAIQSTHSSTLGSTNPLKKATRSAALYTACLYLSSVASDGGALDAAVAAARGRPGRKPMQ